MSESWVDRARRWESEVLEPARARAAERRPRFSTMSDVEIARLYSPFDWAGPHAGGGGPTAVDHLGDPLRARGQPDGADPDGAPGPWADFDPARDIAFPGQPP